MFFIEHNSTLITSKIIGGQNAPWGSYTYIVKLYYVDGSYTTATLISESLVITTAQYINELGAPDFEGAYVEVVFIIFFEYLFYCFNILCIQEVVVNGFDPSLPLPPGDFAIIRVSDFI